MKHTILCVDDEVDNVDALERLFRKKYTVLKATSGTQALRLLEDNDVSLILTDQRMPGMTGVDLLAKSMKSHPHAVRILLTGYTDIESVIAAINSGQIYRYVTKPWDPVDLANAVDKAIERYELSAELKEKNEHLERALRELRTLDEAKSNFMILINHELKTPLTTILSFMELLGETKLDDEQRKFCGRVQQSAERLRAMIEDSLELVSAETGTAPVKITRNNVEKMFSELESEHEGTLSKKQLTLNHDWLAREVQADTKALRSILRRLLDNAVKFARDKSEIEIAVLPADEGFTRVRISNDSGKALKADTLARILKPFSLDEDIMHHAQGSGLGLSVVQAWLRRLGSELELKSTKTQFEASFILKSGK